MFRTGRTVFYPRCGPCSVAGIATRPGGRDETLFYHLIVLGNHGDVFVPVDNARALGLRALLTRAEIPTLLERLRRTADSSGDWKQRRRDNLRRMASGSAFDLAETVNSLAIFSDTHKLSVGDSGMLLQARALLIDEISNVMGTTRGTAEEQIDRSLDERRQP